MKKRKTVKPREWYQICFYSNRYEAKMIEQKFHSRAKVERARKLHLNGASMFSVLVREVKKKRVSRENPLQRWLRIAVEEFFGRRGRRTGVVRIDPDGGGGVVNFPDKNRYGLHKVRYNHGTLWQIAGSVYGLEREAVQKKVLELYKESFPERKSKAGSVSRRSRGGSRQPTGSTRKPKIGDRAHRKPKEYSIKGLKGYLRKNSTGFEKPL